MQIEITYKNFDLALEDKQFVEQKLLSLTKFFDRLSDESARATVSLQREKHLDHKDKMVIRVVIKVPRADFRAENISYTLIEGMEAILTKFKKQFDHFKTRKQGDKKRREAAAFKANMPEMLEQEAEQPAPLISKRKVFSNLIPMTEEEAIQTMQDLGHGFFLFVNELSNQYNFVYKRPNDEGYGIIELLTSDGVL